MKKKSGFTLIEIIICIALIAVIGTVSVVSINRATSVKGEAKILKKNESNFKDALEVYLVDHTEVLENINSNAKAAVVSLELLKNEGLINDDLDIDYKNNYFTLTNAVLLEDENLTEEELEDTCANQIEIKTFASWELNDEATEVVYICPRADETEEKTETNVDDLLERIESLETSLSLLDLGGKNWILFDVNSDLNKIVSCPDGNNQDLWSIIKTDATNKELKLLYNQNLVTDNSKGYSANGIKYSSEPLCDSFYSNKSLTKTYGAMTKDNVKYWDIDKNSYSYSEGYFDENPDFIVEYKGDYYVVKKYSGNKCYRIDDIYIDTSKIYRKHSLNDGKYVVYEDNNQWGYDEMITQKYNTSNSKKAILYNNINNNLKEQIKEKNYKYYYTSNNDYNSTRALESIYLVNNKTYKDKFGTIDTSDSIEEFINSFTGLTFFVGKADYSFSYGNGYRYMYTLRQLSNGTNYNAATSLSWNDSSSTFGFNSNNLTIPKTLIGDKDGTEIYTANYIPVITVGFKNFLNDINEYPANYKEKYSECTSSDLGTKSCPKIIKFSDGTLSWGN